MSPAPAAPRILVVDDERDFATGLRRLVAARRPEAETAVAFDAAQALVELERSPVDLVLTDLRMPGMDGLALVRETLARRPDAVVVLLTAHGSIETAVAALKEGAYDFLTKPVDPDTLYRVLEKGLALAGLQRENQRLRQRLAERADQDPMAEMRGESLTMVRLKEAVAAVAAADYTVLVTGESGTGKELVARALHRLSARAGEPFVAVNCPAIPSQLLESELFGHAKGAFTGADRARKGIFRRAGGGVVFLDEVGELPLEIQSKLLRVLQEGEVRPVGVSRSEAVAARVVAATNRDMEAAVREGRFREDLYYRLNVLGLRVPSLAQRREDIPLLAAHFLHEADPALEFTPEALALLQAGDWPGNVRELQNTVRKAAVFARESPVGVDTLRTMAHTMGQAPPRRPEGLPPYKEAKDGVLARFTQSYLDDLMRRAGGNVSEAARLAGLERVSLQKILKRHGVDAAAYRS